MGLETPLLTKQNTEAGDHSCGRKGSGYGKRLASAKDPSSSLRAGGKAHKRAHRTDKSTIEQTESPLVCDHGMGGWDTKACTSQERLKTATPRSLTRRPAAWLATVTV